MTTCVATAAEMSKCLRLLREATGPKLAATMAPYLGLHGTRETQRRHVRELVRLLREDGHWIVATLSGGYWLTRETAIWREYVEKKSIDAKCVLAEASKRRYQIAASGQLPLFSGAPR